MPGHVSEHARGQASEQASDRASKQTSTHVTAQASELAQSHSSYRATQSHRCTKPQIATKPQSYKASSLQSLIACRGDGGMREALRIRRPLLARVAWRVEFRPSPAIWQLASPRTESQRPCAFRLGGHREVSRGVLFAGFLLQNRFQNRLPF